MDDSDEKELDEGTTKLVEAIYGAIGEVMRREGPGTVRWRLTLNRALAHVLAFHSMTCRKDGCVGCTPEALALRARKLLDEDRVKVLVVPEEPS